MDDATDAQWATYWAVVDAVQAFDAASATDAQRAAWGATVEALRDGS